MTARLTWRLGGIGSILIAAMLLLTGVQVWPLALAGLAAVAASFLWD